MPDTMLQNDVSPVLTPAHCGVMDGYRSAQIGKLVAARAKSSAKIKSIIKAKKATVESRREGGRGYQYAYADLADVLEAIEEAISEQGLAIIQTTQSRRDGVYLITTLAHESDQWVAGEIRLKAVDGGPQVLGSEMTYARRYAVLAALALAPETDDDGRAAQDRADQSRQRPAQRVEPPRRSQPAPEQTQAIQPPPSAPDEPVHMPLPVGTDGPLFGRWTRAALDDLHGRPEPWRRCWLELHQVELDDLRRHKPEYADKVASVAVAPDLPTEQPAAE